MLSRFILRLAFASIAGKTTLPFAVRFANGSEFSAQPGAAPVFKIIFHTTRAQWGVLLFGPVGLVDHYFKQNIDIEGDITQMVILNGQYGSKSSLKNPINWLRNRVHEWRHTNHYISNAKKNALYHYNRGTEMFRKYLDPTMTYTCAYWKEGTTTLAQAQNDKLEHVCRKLNLKPGQTLLDVGSGWGSLLFHAYERYGALGTNASPTPDQNRAMAEEVHKRGLEGKIKIQEVDFREVEGIYDKYVSLGVYEHAGYHQLEAWIEAMARSLKDGGTGVLHFIGTIRRDLEGTGYFIRHYIFPGGYLPGLAETIELMDKHGLEVLDIENLRRHYAPTLRSWAENFDRNWQTINALDPKNYDEYFRRLWRFYLYSCSGVFLSEGNSVGLFQIVFSKGRTSTYPMTRDFLYPSGMPHELVASSVMEEKILV